MTAPPPRGSSVADHAGNWSITSAQIPVGTHQITAKASNARGTSVASQPLEVTVLTVGCGTTTNPIISGTGTYADKEACIATESIKAEPSVLIRSGADVIYKAPLVILGPASAWTMVGNSGPARRSILPAIRLVPNRLQRKGRV